MDVKEVLFQWFKHFFDKKSASFEDKSASSGAIENKKRLSKEFAEEVPKPIIRKFKKTKLYSLFIENNQGGDLVDTQLIRKFNKGFQFLLCAIDIVS